MKLFSRSQVRERSIDWLKRKLRTRLDDYPVPINDITSDNKFFRGVLWDSPPKTTDQLSYPPAHVVTKLGRLNRVGQPIFYGSCAAPAVFYELHAEQGQYIALSTWRVQEPLWMHNLGFHPDTLRRIGGTFAGLRFSNPIRGETEASAALRRTLSEAFSEMVPEGKEYQYKLPIAINELLFDRAGPLPTDLPNGPRIDRAAGTVYPALRMRGAADNVAIQPEFADRALRPTRASFVLIEAANPETLSYTILSVAEADKFVGNEIIWREGLADERQRRGQIAFENGQWILRDGLNEIYAIR
jgi:hypothetical protein